MTKLQDEFNKFNNVAKLMNKTNISKNPDTLSGYRRLIIAAYNKFVTFVSANYFKVTQTNQYILDDSLERVRFVLIKCLENIGCTFELPVDLKELVDERSVSEIRTNNTNGASAIASSSATTSSSLLSSQQGATSTNTENLKSEQVEGLNPLVSIFDLCTSS